MTDIPPYTHTRENFLALFPELRDVVVQDPLFGHSPDFAKEWISKMLDYNVPKGKLNRGMAVYDVVATLKQPHEVTGDDVKEANVVGWCIEWLQAFLLVADDIMDQSVTRRGQPCWYKQPHVGLIACNDGIILETCVHRLLKKYLSHKACYLPLLELFHESLSRTTYGQLLDLITTPKEKGDLSRCTMENYIEIATYKTSYYSFYLPIAAGFVLTGIQDPAIFKLAEEILIPMGQYFQIQDDYLDCYADPEVLGKIGTDIQDKKCSWLLCKALSLCSPTQKEILMRHYGEMEFENIQAVKALYIKLQLEKHYLKYEEESYQALNTKIVEQDLLPEKVFSNLLDRIYKRRK